jgi:hypothetical protein
VLPLAIGFPLASGRCLMHIKAQLVEAPAPAAPWRGGCQAVHNLYVLSPIGIGCMSSNKFGGFLRPDSWQITSRSSYGVGVVCTPLFVRGVLYAKGHDVLPGGIDGSSRIWPARSGGGQSQKCFNGQACTFQQWVQNRRRGSQSLQTHHYPHSRLVICSFRRLVQGQTQSG